MKGEREREKMKEANAGCVVVRHFQWRSGTTNLGRRINTVKG
jgi:hypothetical protein